MTFTADSLLSRIGDSNPFKKALVHAMHYNYNFAFLKVAKGERRLAGFFLFCSHLPRSKLSSKNTREDTVSISPPKILECASKI